MLDQVSFMFCAVLWSSISCERLSFDLTLKGGKEGKLFTPCWPLTHREQNSFHLWFYTLKANETLKCERGFSDVASKRLLYSMIYIPPAKCSDASQIAADTMLPISFNCLVLASYLPPSLTSSWVIGKAYESMTPISCALAWDCRLFWEDYGLLILLFFIFLIYVLKWRLWMRIGEINEIGDQ